MSHRASSLPPRRGLRVVGSHESRQGFRRCTQHTKTLDEFCYPKIGAQKSGTRVYAVILAIAFGLMTSHQTQATSPEPIVIVVMDPLSQPLSCDCVAGYAQRDYEKLGKYLQREMSYPIEVVWNGSLVEAIRETRGRASVVIGKHSVVLADAKELGAMVEPRFTLTGKAGDATQHGLIVVRGADPAKNLADLAGYQVLFGPDDNEEKSGAAREAISRAGVKLAEDGQVFGACSEAATAMLESEPDAKIAAVISSYAEPLLEGCGSIRKGDLRVVGKTKPVPFITAFFNAGLPPSLASQLAAAFAKVSTKAELLTSLETQSGFIPFNPVMKTKVDRPTAGTGDISKNAKSWPTFRGPDRNGRVQWLPSRLPREEDLLWSATLPSACAGGLAVDEGRVFLGTRDASDQDDLFMAFSLDEGELIWTHQYPAPASLDYGNAPRATPECCGEVIVTLGATGTLSGLDRASGSPLWSWNLSEKFDAPIPTWGWSGSPLRIDDMVLLQGNAEHSLFACDWVSGEVKWKTSGVPTAYASLIRYDADQVIAIKDDSIDCHATDDGRLRWSHRMGKRKPFGVPSAVVAADRLFIADEVYGVSRLEVVDKSKVNVSGVNDYHFPDSQTPVMVGDQLLVAHEGLHCLDLRDDELRTIWSVGESTINGHASIIASPSRAMVLDESGNWMLVQLKGDDCGTMLDQRRLGDDNQTLLSHPAISGDRLLVAVGSTLSCYRMTR